MIPPQPIIGEGTPIYDRLPLFTLILGPFWWLFSASSGDGCQFLTD